MAEQVTRASNRKNVSCNSTFPLCSHTLLQANLEALSFGLCGRVDRPVGPTRSVFVIQLTTCSDANPLCSGYGLKVTLVPQVFLFLPGDLVCGTSKTPD